MGFGSVCRGGWAERKVAEVENSSVWRVPAVQNTQDGTKRPRVAQTSMRVTRPTIAWDEHEDGGRRRDRVRENPSTIKCPGEFVAPLLSHRSPRDGL
jgi:hypothetical protein